jgi:predicted RNA binding protein YcfA (HicA-like mRNA interferase family)
MPRKIRELKADLRREGFVSRSAKGSHTFWKHPLLPGRITLSGADGHDARPYQEADVQDAIEKLRDLRRKDQP